MLLICDSESNGFKWEADRLWCIAAYNPKTNTVFISYDKKYEKVLDKELKMWYNSSLYKEHNKGANNIYNNYNINKYIKAYLESYYKRAFNAVELLTHSEMITLLQLADTTVWHNGYMHDKPLLEKFFPQLRLKQIEDTFVLSSLFNPDRPNPKGCKTTHSMEAWGLRFGLSKVENEEWDKFSFNILTRCVGDVILGNQLYEYLQEERNKHDWEEAIKLEYECAAMQGKQEMNGVDFDLNLAYELVEDLDNKLAELSHKLYEELPLRVTSLGEEKAPFKKDGKLKKKVVDYFN